LKKITWYFPSTLEEVPELLKKEGLFIHGGGTALLRSNLARVEGLIDLKALTLNYCREREGVIEIGAGCTYSQITEVLQKIDSHNILIRALSSAASSPLRNRITLGGSIAFFPVWSDLMGPLLVLEAEVTLIGPNKGSFPLVEYLKKREIRNRSLITGISFKKRELNSYYFRQSCTSFDYSAFSISMLVKKSASPAGSGPLSASASMASSSSPSASRIEEAAIVIVGSRNKFTRLSSLEDSLKGCSPADLQLKDIGSSLEVEFAAKKNYSPDYLKHLTAVELERALKAVLRS
jgi:CO/xanthine dehydrogenase FAD-binding subunit